ncbi:uncharacterized protein [Drosophila takahashii]|uniref:uncharacterized protein isoform X4 n=1 Tax=Drosophila takahashii TaxID=29030 RepID=UPI0038990519
MFEETANKYPACVPKNFLINLAVKGSNPGNKIIISGCETCLILANNHGNRTGYQCHYEDDSAVAGKFGSTENEYPKCIPNEYELIRDINEYCCFWSPELGCSVLLGIKSNYEYNTACNKCLELCNSPQEDDDDVDANNAIDINSKHIAALVLALLLLL